MVSGRCYYIVINAREAAWGVATARACSVYTCYHLLDYMTDLTSIIDFAQNYKIILMFSINLDDR